MTKTNESALTPGTIREGDRVEMTLTAKNESRTFAARIGKVDAPAADGSVYFTYVPEDPVRNGAWGTQTLRPTGPRPFGLQKIVLLPTAAQTFAAEKMLAAGWSYQAGFGAAPQAWDDDNRGLYLQLGDDEDAQAMIERDGKVWAFNGREPVTVYQAIERGARAGKGEGE